MLYFQPISSAAAIIYQPGSLRRLCSSIFIQANKNQIAVRSSSFRRFLLSYTERYTGSSKALLQCCDMPYKYDFCVSDVYQLRNFGMDGLISQRVVIRARPSKVDPYEVLLRHRYKLEKKRATHIADNKGQKDDVPHECQNSAREWAMSELKS